MGREITNTVCYNLFCHPPTTRAQVFCWLIITSVALSKLALMPATPFSVLPVLQFLWGSWVSIQPCNPCSIIFCCCFQIVIHISFITVVVSVLQISPCWPANPINLNMIRWGSIVILGLTDFYATCPESATPALPQQADLSPGNLPSPLSTTSLGLRRQGEQF